MSESTNDKIELSESRTKLWAVLGMLAFLVVMVQGVFTYIITSSASEMKETNRNLTETNLSIRVLQTQVSYQQKDIETLKSNDKEHDRLHNAEAARLQSIEQRLEHYDEWIKAHTN